VFERHIEPFLEHEQPTLFLGADAVVDKQSGRIKLLEVNPQAQALGKFDVVGSELLGGDGPNACISPVIKPLIDELIGEDSGVVISHPSNTFHKHHLLFGEQIGLPVVTLQDLEVGSNGEVRYGGRKVSCMFKQCSMNSILDPEITDTGVVAAIREGKVNLVNGPLAPFLGDKSLLPLLPELGAEIGGYLPDMRVVRSGEEVDLVEYKDWWLKGETRGVSEMTLQLSGSTRSGWTGRVIRSVLKGDFDGAEYILKDRDNSTARRLLQHVKDFQEKNPGCFLLQENIPPTTVSVRLEDGSVQELRSMLRMYFVPNTDSSKKPHVFLEMYAGSRARVSAAGYSIPVKRAA